MKLRSKRTAAGILSLAMLLGCAGAMPASAAQGGVTINEACSKNTVFAAADGNYYDWIELYNSGSQSADLTGWGLSDKATKPYRFTFPAGTSIAPGGRLVVYCDSTLGTTDTTAAPFGLSASGETLTLTDASGNTVDTITFGALAADTSYGQYPDGSGEYFTLASATPSSANSAPEGADAVRLPEFSKDSGFYDSGFELTITVPEGTTVYYTTDGSDPNENSNKYTAPISITDMTNTPNVLSAHTDISASGADAPNGNVDKGAIVRAVAVDSQGRVSNCVTKTYFVGTTASGYYKNMKVVSLVTDPDNLFDYDKGIYVLGRVYDEENKTSGPQNPWGGWGGWGGMVNPWEMAANYTQKGKEWEREASFELFENGESVLSQNVGIRIKGAASRSAPQKSFNIYARQDYGTPELAYDFFEGRAVKAKNSKSIKSYDSIVIRNGGNDTGYAWFRDSINQRLVSDRDMATQATSECMMFIDGEFWGVYQMTEKVSDSFISDHYGIKKSDAVILKNDEIEEGTDADLTDWNDLIKGVADGSTTYSQFAEKVDVQSFMDYFAAQIYWSNADWPQNNVAVWRSNAIDETNPWSDGKWRMFLFDTESGQGLYGNEDKSVNADCFSRISRNTDDLSRAFTALMKDKDFSKEFARTFMDIANYNFAPEKAQELISFFKETYRQQILDSYERFYSKSLSGEMGVQRFDQEYRTISDFYQNRMSTAERTLRSAAGLTDKLYTVTINNSPDMGAVYLNTLTLDDETQWSGKYHTDYAMTLDALPREGLSFSHWEITSGGKTEKIAQASYSFTLAGDTSVTAVYGDAVRGDYNSDGQVNAADLVLLSKYLLGQKVKLSKAADALPDGVTNVFDMAELRSIVTLN